MKKHSYISKKENHENFKKRVIRTWGKDQYGYNPAENSDFIFYSETKKRCSCFVCGNPRKMFNEKTFQEIKSEQKYFDDVEYMKTFKTANDYLKVVSGE